MQRRRSAVSEKHVASNLTCIVCTALMPMAQCEPSEGPRVAGWEVWVAIPRPSTSHPCRCCCCLDVGWRQQSHTNLIHFVNKIAAAISTLLPLPPLLQCYYILLLLNTPMRPLLYCYCCSYATNYYNTTPTAHGKSCTWWNAAVNNSREHSSG